MAAEKILWDSAAVGGQMASLRGTLNRCLDDAATSLRQAQNRLQRQDVPFAIVHSLEASVRRLEQIRENAQALWHGTRLAQETLDQAERDLVAFVSALMKGEDAVLPLPPAGKGPVSLSPFAGRQLAGFGAAALINQIPPHFAGGGEPDGGCSLPSVSLTVKPIAGIEAMLKGRTTVRAAWAAPQSVIAPWLAKMVNI